MSSIFSSYNVTGGEYRSVPIVAPEGSSQNLQTDINGYLKVVFPASQGVNVTNTPSVTISGTPSVNATCSGTVSAVCSGTVAVSGISGTVTVAGSVSAACSGTVTVSSITNPVTVSGTVSVSSPPAVSASITNIPHTIVDSGSVTATISGTPTVNATCSGTVNAVCSGTVTVSSVTNPITVASVTNPVTVASVTNPVTVSSITNPITVSSITNPITVTQLQWLPFRDAAGVATAFLVKASPGFTLGAVLKNTNAATRFFQLFNKATAPVAGDTPIWSIAVATNAVSVYNGVFDGNGMHHTAGIACGWSSTEATYTAATANQHSTCLSYR